MQVGNMTHPKTILEKCQSPIEEMLAQSLIEVIDREDSQLEIYPQWEVGPYRADFAIGYKDEIYLVVECDGHDFHDRTKEQAAKDRRRDREILEVMGVITVRFTGSEIWNDADDCAVYCISTAMELSYLKSLASLGFKALEAAEASNG